MASKKEQKVSRNGRRLLIVYLFEINKDKKTRNRMRDKAMKREREEGICKVLGCAYEPKDTDQCTTASGDTLI